MTPYGRSLAMLLGLVAALEGVVIPLGLRRPLWGDEAHFVETVRQFGAGITLNTLRHYNEMSTPLPFVLYSLWGRLFDFEVSTLRLFSVLVAVITYLCFHSLLFSLFEDSRLAVGMTAFLAVHPYMIGFSIFVFTDMLAMLCVILCCLSVRNQAPVLLGLSSAAGLLCRQYFAFLSIAAGLHFLLRFRRQKDVRAGWMVLGALGSFLPLLSLCVLWRGLSPENELRDLYLKDGFAFRASILTLYIVQMFVYLLPVVLICWKSLYTDRRVLAWSFGISWLYWWVPVSAAPAQIEANFQTVGIFHRLIRAVFGAGLEGGVFYACFLLALPVVLSLLRDGFARWKSGDAGFVSFLNLAVMSFLLTMPFSYLGWEKYFLPAVPIAAMQLLLKRREARVTAAVRTGVA